MNPESWTMVMIEYDDARIENGQITIDEAGDLTPVFCRAVGWQVAQNERAVSLVMERFIFGDVDDRVRGSLVIPKATIKSRTLLKPAADTTYGPPWDDWLLDVGHLKSVAEKLPDDDPDQKYLLGLSDLISKAGRNGEAGEPRYGHVASQLAR